MTGGGSTNLAKNGSVSTNGALRREHDASSSQRPETPLWVFGYGSLIWKTNFPYEDCVVGRVRGYARKFWQGDVDHRGAPGAPGRVATLVQKDQESTWGVAFKVNASQVCATIAYLNARERGYSMHKVTFYPCKSRDMPPMTVAAYVGTEMSPTYLGPASVDNIARQIISTKGSSGSNTDYVLNLASSMREIAPEVDDEHLFSLEARIKELLLLSSSALPHVPQAEQRLRVDGIISTESGDAEDGLVNHNRESGSVPVF